MKRRDFFTAVPLGALALAQVKNAAAQEAPLAEKTAVQQVPFLPFLQNPGTDSMTVAWAVGGRATGYVEYGETAELGKQAFNTLAGLKPLDDTFLFARITGLKSGTTYYYRAVTIPYKDDNKPAGEPVCSPIHSFRTVDPRASRMSFAMINDTHENQAILKELTAKLPALKPDYIIWNGDILNDVHSAERTIASLALPAGVFSAESPLLYLPGNHDCVGPWVHNLSRLMVPWEQENPQERALSYNFAFRQGPVALVGLDTGASSADAAPAWGGLIAHEPYRAKQAEWLAKVLKRPDIASAPFLVAICHIPLFEPDQTLNGGDTTDDWARFSRQGLTLWGPLLHKAGAQIVLSAHRHALRREAGTPQRCWDQIIGGGRDLDKDAAIVFGEATTDKLTLTMRQLNGTEYGVFEYKPRNFKRNGIRRV
ncbi:MAG: metallophosphoesterase [Planctomycetaceae bacterium]|jgi:hypothetical protein|nr:metallophosphoesterase [Planctomycetaceae bacterium]